MAEQQKKTIFPASLIQAKSCRKETGLSGKPLQNPRWEVSRPGIYTSDRYLKNVRAMALTLDGTSEIVAHNVYSKLII